MGIGIMAKQMELGNWHNKMGFTTKENGKMTNLMAKEFKETRNTIIGGGSLKEGSRDLVRRQLLRIVLIKGSFLKMNIMVVYLLKVILY
jgi:hypothetical protein